MTITSLLLRKTLLCRVISTNLRYIVFHEFVLALFFQICQGILSVHLFLKVDIKNHVIYSINTFSYVVINFTSANVCLYVVVDVRMYVLLLFAKDGFFQHGRLNMFIVFYIDSLVENRYIRQTIYAR